MKIVNISLMLFLLCLSTLQAQEIWVVKAQKMELLQGTWKSSADPKHTFKIEGNTIYTYYEGKLDNVEYFFLTSDPANAEQKDRIERFNIENAIFMGYINKETGEVFSQYNHDVGKETPSYSYVIVDEYSLFLKTSFSVPGFDEGRYDRVK